MPARNGSAFAGRFAGDRRLEISSNRGPHLVSSAAVSLLWPRPRKSALPPGVFTMDTFPMVVRERLQKRALFDCANFTFINVALAGWQLGKHLGVFSPIMEGGDAGSLPNSTWFLILACAFSTWLFVAISACALGLMTFYRTEARWRQRAGEPVSAAPAFFWLSYLVPVVQLIAPPILLRRLAALGGDENRKLAARRVAFYWSLLALGATLTTLWWPLAMLVTVNWTVPAILATGGYVTTASHLLLAGAGWSLRPIVRQIGAYPLSWNPDALSVAQRTGAFRPGPAGKQGNVV